MKRKRKKKSNSTWGASTGKSQRTDAIIKNAIESGIGGFYNSTEASDEWTEDSLKLAQAASELYDRGDYEEAIKSFSKLIELCEKDDSLYSMRGLSYAKLKQFKPAIEDMSLAIELAPTEEYYTIRAECHRYLGNLQNAVDDYTEALKICPTDTSVRTNRAVLNTELSEFQKAADDYTKLIELVPKEASYFSGRAFCYRSLGQEKKANSDEEHARQLASR